ncbi:ABC transporter permease subunit [Nonomuraea thailandensis]
MAASALITNPAWEWEVVGQYLFAPSVVRSVLLTLELTALGIGLGFALGTVLALMRLSPNRLLSSVAFGYVWLFRSVPLILQLLFWYNLALLYPRLSVGVPFGPAFFDFGTMDLIGPLTAAVLGLALHQAAYAAEIVRGGLLSVDQGQREAAAALCRRRGGCSGSSCRRPCGPSSPTRATRSSAWSRAPRWSTSWRCPSCSTRCR